MLDVYKDFYKFTEVPFRLSPDHRFSFEHPSYAQAKAYLEYAIFQGEGFITITGLPGTGKTTLINEILSEVDQSHIRVATVTSTQLDARDFLHMVAASFGLQFAEENKVTLLRALAHFLIQQHRQGLRCVLIVDEAQGLSASALEELRLLANLQHKNNLVLQVCLVGQEQLREVIGAPEMEHLRQRMIASAHLDPLDYEETITYIEHRLVCAGWLGDPAFSEAALRHIYQASGGIPRRINLICNRMFLHGGLAKKHELDGEDAQQMIGELREEMLLAPGEAIDTADAGSPDHATGDAMHRLPRGEILDRMEEQKRERQANAAEKRTAAAKADFFAEVAASKPPATAPHTQPAVVTAQPRPAQARTARRGMPSPLEEPPPPPEGSRLKVVLAVLLALLLASLIAFMLMMALQQDHFDLVKQAQDKLGTLRGEALPAVQEPRMAPAANDTPVPAGRAPEIAQPGSRTEPSRGTFLPQSGDPARGAPEAVPALEPARTPLQSTPVDTPPGTAAQDAAGEPQAAPPVEPPATNAGKTAPTVAPQLAAATATATATTKNLMPAAEILAAAAEETAAAVETQALTKKNAAAPAEPQATDAKAGLAAEPQAATARKTAPTLEPKPEPKPEPEPGPEPEPEQQAPPKVAAPPLTVQAGQRVAPSLTSPEQQQTSSGATQPVAAAERKRDLTVASLAPTPSPAPVAPPALAAGEARAALLSGRWLSGGQPAGVLPSEVTFCSSAGQVINCWSVPQRSSGADGKVAYKVEATLSNFSDAGAFQLLDRRLELPLGANPTDDKQWRVLERLMSCKMVRPDSVYCSDREGNSTVFRRSVLGR